MDFATNWRGEESRISCKYNEVFYPYKFSKGYDPTDILARILANADNSSFELDSEYIQNSTTDGLPLLSVNHTAPFAGSGTWSNKLTFPYSMFAVPDADYMISPTPMPKEFTENTGIKCFNFPEITDILKHENWHFVFSSKRLKLHFKFLDDGFEFCIPEWYAIAGTV